MPVDGRSLCLLEGHPYHDLMHKKARYKVYWGGRGAAKSWAFAEALIRMAQVRAIRVMCLREFQNSIKESSHRILWDTIKRLGMSAFFHVTQESIKSTCGAEFVFRGMNDLTENTVRSMEGFDIAWVEEAHSFSNGSWRTLLPTLRKAGSELWISYNMSEENDATHQIFVIKGRPNSIVHHINYDQNPYMSQELIDEMETDREQDFELYEHIWLGKPKKRSNAIIFNGKYRVKAFDEDLWMLADRLHFGADHGFANDPATLTRSFILRNKLYIEYAAFWEHKDIAELYGNRELGRPALYDEVPGSRDWPIMADNSRPETISHAVNEGWNLIAAEKWPGSVEDGIAHIRKFDEIIIHPRCVKMAEEAYMYRYKVDRKKIDEQGQPLVLPIIVDAFNHGWDAVRYSLDGHITRGGALGKWARLGEAA